MPTIYTPAATHCHPNLHEKLNFSRSIITNLAEAKLQSLQWTQLILSIATLSVLQCIQFVCSLGTKPMPLMLLMLGSASQANVKVKQNCKVLHRSSLCTRHPFWQSLLDFLMYLSYSQFL